jgi:hypothetical protein
MATETKTKQEHDPTCTGCPECPGVRGEAARALLRAQDTGQFEHARALSDAIARSAPDEELRSAVDDFESAQLDGYASVLRAATQRVMLGESYDPYGAPPDSYAGAIKALRARAKHPSGCSCRGAK